MSHTVKSKKVCGKNIAREFMHYQEMFKYINSSQKLEAINKLLEKDTRYEKIRNRCNDNVHYNFYYNLLMNDNEIYNKERIKHLNTFSHDIENIFIQHLGYLFYLNDHYMCSFDYIDCIELGLQPEIDSEYWVANFIQEVFDKVIKPKRADIADEIKNKTMMQLG